MIIAVISSVTAILGAILLAILALRLRSINDADTLRKHRSKDESVSDLLNYAAEVEDGIVIGKNGSLMAAWLYQGEDNDNATTEQRNVVSFHINQALAGLGNGWMIHVDAVRRHASNYSEQGLSHFPDPITQAIDEERRSFFEQQGALYEGYFVVTVTYFPPVLAQAKFVELLFDDDRDQLNGRMRTQGLIDGFRHACDNVEARLSSALKLERLRCQTLVTEEGREISQDNFLSYLHFCVTGKNHPILLPPVPMYLDAVIGGQEMWSGVVPKIGRNFIQVVAIEGFPLESHPGMLAQLADLPVEYRWSSRFIFMDSHEAVAHLEKFRKKWRQKIRGFFDQVFNTNSGSIDQDAVSMVQDAEAALADVNSGLVSAGYYTSVVVLMDEDRDRVEVSARQLEKAINSLGFAARVETINALDAFLGTLPGHGVENVRRPILNTMNLADLLPTSTIWTGSANAPCPMYPPLSPALMHCVTTGSSPFRLNLHVRDLGHTLLFGPTGAGKSTHLGMLAAQLRRYRGMRIFAFDKGMAMYPLCKAIGGRHYAVAGADETLAFCPLQNLNTKSARAWAMEWLDTLLALNGVQTTAAQRNEIGKAVVNMHATGSFTLTDFTSSVQDQDIRDALSQYTIAGVSIPPTAGLALTKLGVRF